MNETNGLPSHLQLDGGDEIEYIMTMTTTPTKSQPRGKSSPQKTIQSPRSETHPSLRSPRVHASRSHASIGRRPGHAPPTNNGRLPEPGLPTYIDEVVAEIPTPLGAVADLSDVPGKPESPELPGSSNRLRPETPSSSSSSFQSATPSGGSTPLPGNGTPLGVAFARPRTSSSDAGRHDSESESEEEEEEDGGGVKSAEAAAAATEGVTLVQTDRFGFFVGSEQYSGNTSLPNKISVERMRRRERKWLDMIDNWERWMSKRFHKIKDRCRKGIPPSLRALSWSYLCGSKYMMEHHEGRYERLLQMEHDPRWVDDITKDLHRQFPCHEMFATAGGWGQKNLFNVLIAYATHNPVDGYCQAMAPLASVLLMHMPEEQAFWSLTSICDRYMPGYYSAGLEQVQIDGEVLFGLLKKSSNVTYKHLKKQRVDPILIMMEWFMCVFSRTLPWPSVLRVWDMFFCEGIKVLFRVALVLFKSVLGTSAQCAECPGLYETVEALKNIPAEALAEEYLIAESLKLNVDEKDMEREHRKQVKKRQKEKEAREKELESKKSGESKNDKKKRSKKS